MKLLKLLILILIANTGLSQLSIKTALSFADFRKNIPLVGVAGPHYTGSYDFEIEYKFSNEHSVVLIKSYIGNGFRHEQNHYYPDGFRMYADYDKNVNVLAGYKHLLNKSKFITPFIGLSAGFWQNEIWIYALDFPSGAPFYEWSGESKMLAFGPNLGILIGKKRVKGTIEFEELFFTGYRDIYLFEERLTKMSLGIMVSLHK